MAFPKLDTSGRTDVGLKRTKNEDSFKILIPPPGTPQYSYGALFIVADGMGGLGGGDLASASTIEEIIREYYGTTTPFDTPELRLQSALESANDYVRQQAQRVGLPYIGSTIAGLLITSERAGIFFNVGDSRVYRIRKGQIELLSHDQSVMAQQIASGTLSEEEAKRDRNSNITSFIGQPIPLQPVYMKADLEPDDIFVLCSDGLWSLVESGEIRAAVQSVPAEQGTRKLIKLALKAGAYDNVTAIIVRIGAHPRQYWRWLAAIGLCVAVGLLAASLFALKANSNQQIDAPTLTGSPNASLFPLNSTESIVESGLMVLSPTPTKTFSPTDTPQPTDTPTATMTNSPTGTASPTALPTTTSTATPSGTSSPTRTPTATATTTSLPTVTPTLTRTVTRTPTATVTVTYTPSSTAIPSSTLEATVTLRPELVSSTPSLTPIPTVTPTATPSTTLTMTPYPYMYSALLPCLLEDGGLICTLAHWIYTLIHPGVP